MKELSPRERLLTVYRGDIPDRVPISPWVYKMICMQFSKLRPFWKAQLETYNHFGIDGIIMLGMESRPDRIQILNSEIKFPNGDVGTQTIYRGNGWELKEIYRESVSSQTGWFIEKPVQNFKEDFPKLMEVIFLPSDRLDVSQINQIEKQIGDRALVQGGVGQSFFSFVNRYYNCKLDELILKLIDNQDFFELLQQKHLNDIEVRIRKICETTSLKALFCVCESLSVIGPKMWRKWEKPFIMKFVQTAKEYGVFTHLHQHGICKSIMEDIIECGVDVVCPLEPPPGGDIEDIGEIKRKYGDKIVLRGNIHTLEVMLRGTPEKVRQSVKECIEKASAGGRFILSTGEEVSGLTPYENIEAFVAAGKEFGNYTEISQK